MMVSNVDKISAFRVRTFALSLPIPWKVVPDNLPSSSNALSNKSNKSKSTKICLPSFGISLKGSSSSLSASSSSNPATFHIWARSKSLHQSLTLTQARKIVPISNMSGPSNTPPSSTFSIMGEISKFDELRGGPDILFALALVLALRGISASPAKIVLISDTAWYLSRAPCTSFADNPMLRILFSSLLAFRIFFLPPINLSPMLLLPAVDSSTICLAGAVPQFSFRAFSTMG
mmetsp:Transcript_3091/g.4557  ORF Transcript_3091/g.4557 Transcript_3091/m.4557 type:complete len:232 (+) Transcript_3091:2178-2873(+)